MVQGFISFDVKKKKNPTTMTVVPSELSSKKKHLDRDDRHNNNKWGSLHLHTPADPPRVHNSLHYPASETPVVENSSWNSWTQLDTPPTPAAPFFLSSSLFSNLRSSTTTRRRSPGSQPSKNDSTRRSQNRNHNVRDGDESTPSSQVACLNKKRLSNAKSPRKPHHRNFFFPPLKRQREETNKKRRRRTNVSSTGASRGSSVVAEMRSAARCWRKQRAVRHGRVAKKKMAPQTRRLTAKPRNTTASVTKKRRRRETPRAPCNSTQMLMHLYNCATTATTTRTNNNKKKNKKEKEIVRPFSSLASPRLDGSPVRLASAASIGNLLRGHIDTFGTLLRSPPHPTRTCSRRLLRGDSNGGNGAGYTMSGQSGGDSIGGDDGGCGCVTPPFSPIDVHDIDMHDIDTFGSHLDERDSSRSSSSSGDETYDDDDDEPPPPCEDELELGCHVTRLPSDVFDHGGVGWCRASRGGGERTPLRRSFSNVSNATNSTWLGDEDGEEEEEKEGLAPSVLTSPVAWTPASPITPYCR